MRWREDPVLTVEHLSMRFGGVQSLLGTVASSYLIGQADGILAFLSDDTMAKAVVFLGVVVLIRLFPQGLFAMRVRRS